jgi:hypothetical protein
MLSTSFYHQRPGLPTGFILNNILKLCIHFSSLQYILSLSVVLVITHKKQPRGLSPRANYTERATPAVGEVSVNFCG